MDESVSSISLQNILNQLGKYDFFFSTIPDKIFEINSTFFAKQRPTEKVQFPFTCGENNI